jgi:hypothetical protein
MIQYLKRLFNREPCTHRFRCIHGDEIIAHRWARAICMDCGKTEKQLPLFCYYTKDLHSGYQN